MLPLTGAVLGGAVLLDLLIGDPRWLPHPVVGLGRTISWLDRLLRRPGNGKWALRVKGLVLALGLTGGTYLLGWWLLKTIYRFSFWGGQLAAVWLLSTTIAARGLVTAGRDIYRVLERGDLIAARRKLAWIVGRDTADLPEGEIVRGTVETIAENIVDGIISPLCYALIGGVPLALAYRAVNTLDSMVGYKDERYRDFGLASARLDDLANLIPARLCGGLLLLAALLAGYRVKDCWRSLRRDARQHPSPNSGFPEAAVAGALGVRLGGLNYYRGIPSFRAYMGTNRWPLKKIHISQTIKMLYLSYGIFLLPVLCYLVWRGGVSRCL